MRQLRRIACVIAATLFTVGAGLVATTGTAEASHCGGLTFVQANHDTETVSSVWVYNPSLFNPPVCGQRVFASCSNIGPGFGPVTTTPWTTSTVSCPAAFPLIFGGSQVMHLDQFPS